MFYIHAVRVVLPAAVRFFPRSASPTACRSERPRDVRHRRGVATGKRVPHVATRALRPNNFILNTSVSPLKLGGASLTAILYAVLLPLSTLAFGAPFLGQYQEPIVATTLIGLAVVLVGFSLYESDSLVPKEVSLRGVASAAVALRRRRFDVNEQDPLAPRRRHGSQSARVHERLLLPILKVRESPR